MGPVLEKPCSPSSVITEHCACACRITRPDPPMRHTDRDRFLHDMAHITYVTDVVFLCILRWGELTGLLTSVFSQTNLVLGFTTSGIKPKVEFRLSSEFIVTLPISNKKSHSFRICNLPIDFYCVCKNGLCDWSQF